MEIIRMSGNVYIVVSYFGFVFLSSFFVESFVNLFSLGWVYI